MIASTKETPPYTKSSCHYSQAFVNALTHLESSQYFTKPVNSLNCGS